MSGIEIRGARDCVIENCTIAGCDTAVEIKGGEGNRVVRSQFWDNQTDIRIQGGARHALIDNIFGGSRHLSQKEGLDAIRRYLTLRDDVPDREILASLYAVVREHDQNSKRDAARKSFLGRWLIEHGADVNIAVNTLVTIASAVALWFK